MAKTVEQMLAEAYVNASRALLIEVFGNEQQKRELHAWMAENRRKAEAARR